MKHATGEGCVVNAPDIALLTGSRAGLVNMVANISGGVVVFLYLLLLSPTPELSDRPAARAVNVGLFVAAVVVTAGLATWRNVRYLLPLRAWVRAGAPPGPGQARALGYPRFAARVNVEMWLGSLVVFVAANLAFSWALARHVGLAIGLAGLTCCTLSFLLTERVFRPLAATALAAGMPATNSAPGVRTRLQLVWFVSAALPLLGIGLVVTDPASGLSGRLVGALLTLVVVGALAGLLAIRAAGASIAEPVRSLRDAALRVAGGDLSTTVAVFDGSDLGRLQSGFNTMVGGLRERQRLADLFGRQVGSAVAARAIDGVTALGGETRDVAALFVDVIGSTALARSEPPQEVVRRLNAFFQVVVDVTHRHGGLVNKFEGDAALCLFGAPLDDEDAAGAALAAAREMAAALRALPGLRAAIGVSYGQVVAGNVGAESRYEYTAIGDPVNEAARLSELAKDTDERVLASGAALAAARDGHELWSTAGEVMLRGRDAPTTLARPVAVTSTR